MNPLSLLILLGTHHRDAVEALVDVLPRRLQGVQEVFLPQDGPGLSLRLPKLFYL